MTPATTEKQEKNLVVLKRTAIATIAVIATVTLAVVLIPGSSTHADDSASTPTPQWQKSPGQVQKDQRRHVSAAEVVDRGGQQNLLDQYRRMQMMRQQQGMTGQDLYNVWARHYNDADTDTENNPTDAEVFKELIRRGLIPGVVPAE